MIDHRYEVSQIIAEARAKHWPVVWVTAAVAQYFEVNRLDPPISLINWLAEETSWTTPPTRH